MDSAAIKHDSAVDTLIDSAVNQRKQIVDASLNQQVLTTRGQRKINLIWECTQSFIAIAVVITNLAVGLHVGFYGDKGAEVPSMLTNSLFLVIGFYFARTNHAAIGGVGDKPNPQYEGR
jgi:hypothetical protein